MRIETGKRLGPYEIVSLLGKGGMGEVYKAKDVRLDRTVAVKIVTPEVPENETRRQRFLLEARAISSISHPNICALYDVGEEDGLVFFVMEYLQGQTLEERLKRGPLPLAQAIRFALEIAQALEKAHQAGIIHRDLKPANIMITATGIKLLDFGVAKLRQTHLEQEGGEPDTKALHNKLTVAGSVVGTLQYMSPQQLQGAQVDHRTDIFSFGAIVYEMLTGKAAFDADDPSQIIAAILSNEPMPVAQLLRECPPPLSYLVRACLEKDPDHRWSTAQDLALQLKWIMQESNWPSSTVDQKKKPLLKWLLLGLLITASLAVNLHFLSKASPPLPSSRLSILPPNQMAFWTSTISPDGRLLAATIVQGVGKRRIWIRRLNSFQFEPLPGTEDAAWPFWSPDSRFLGFFANGKLKKIDVNGGRAEILCDAPIPFGGAWNKDNVVVFSGREDGTLYQIPSQGGTPQQVTKLEQGEDGHTWPIFLPDGNHVIYLCDSAHTEGHQLKVVSLESKESRTLMPAISNAEYSSSGFLLYGRSETLLAAPFDAKTLKFTGSPFVITKELALVGPKHRYDFSVSNDDTLVYQRYNPLTQIQWIDRQGELIRNVGEPGRYVSIDLSPDENKIVTEELDTEERNGELWLFDLVRGNTSRLTTDPNWDIVPLWSPRNPSIFFGSNRSGKRFDLFMRNLESGKDELLFHSSEPKVPTSWSPDGKFVVFQTNNDQTKYDLWALPLESPPKPFPLLTSEFNESEGQVSPDGKWLAFVSDEGVRKEIYLDTFPPSGRKYQVSNNGGWQPRWRPDGKELFYWRPDQRLVVVDVVENGPALKIGIPRVLFQMHIRDFGRRQDYDVDNSGNRFVVLSLVERSESNSVDVINRWSSSR